MCDIIEFKNNISVEEFCELRESVGFQKLTFQQAKTVLSNTTIIVNAICNGKSVGLVRILTDMLTDAYITDVIIHPEFQGRGLGKRLMEEVLACLKEISINNVKLACSLYANPGKELFYEKCNFQKLPNSTYGYGMLLEL